MRPFGIFLRDAGKTVARGMGVEGIIDDVQTGRVSRNAEVCILGELEFRDRIPGQTDRWAPLSHLANLHWMITSTIPSEKMEFLKTLTGAGDEGHPARDKSDGARKLRKAADCKPLLDVATPELFRTNAFRITGLRVDATTREIAKHTDKLKMMEELGQGKSVHTGAFALKTPPSVDQIREAIQRLKEPEQRIIDEFFWFWPRQFGQSASDPALKALVAGDADAALKIWEALETHPSDGVVAMHNIAVLRHCMALDSESPTAKSSEFTKARMQELEGLWRAAFKRWEILAEDDLFWTSVSARIKQLDDPRLTTGFARRMRATLPQALDKINAELAVRYAKAENMALARLHVQFMRETHPGLDNVGKTAELVLAPAATQLKQQIERTRERAAKKPADIVIAVHELLDQARRTLPLYALFFGKESDTGNDLSDEVANVCNMLSIAHQKAKNDDQACIEILKGALPFAVSKELRLQVEKNIAVLTKNLAFRRLEPIHAILKAIQESREHPSIRLARFKSIAIPAISKTSVGIGDVEAYNDLVNNAAAILRTIAISAWNDHDDKTTALAAITQALYYAKDPELKKRIGADMVTLGGDLPPAVRLESEKPTNRLSTILDSIPRLASPSPPVKQQSMSHGDKVGCFLLLGFALVVLIGLVFNSGTSSSNSSNPSGYHPPLPTPATSAREIARAKTESENQPISSTESLSPSGTQSAKAWLAQTIPPPAITPPTPTPQPIATPVPATPSPPTPSTIKDAPAWLWAAEAPEWRITFVGESELGVQKQAIAMFPSLGVADSPLNKEFVARYKNYKIWRKPYFDNPGWPMMLAWECTREIEGKSTYLVPRTHNDELTAERTRIGTERKILEEYTARITLRAREIDRDRATLNRSNKSAVDAFNGAIESYDALISLAKEQERVVNQLVNDYNEKLRRYGR